MRALLNKAGAKYLMYSLDDTDRQQVLRQMARVLYESGFVKESYIDAVCEREEVFPTGLPMSGMGIAIPHADASHVNEEAMMVGVLKEPVDFIVMGSLTDHVKAQLVFMLAIKDPEEQLEMLQKLIEGCQDEKTLAALYGCKDRSVVERILDDFIKRGAEDVHT